MSNNTLKNFGQSNFGQSLMSDRPDKVTNFLLSTGVEELDDAASAAVNGGFGAGLGLFLAFDVDLHATEKTEQKGVF